MRKKYDWHFFEARQGCVEKIIPKLLRDIWTVGERDLIYSCENDTGCPAGNYFKVNNRNTRTRCEIC